MIDLNVILTSSLTSAFITGGIIYWLQKWIDKRMKTELERKLAKLELDKRKTSLVLDQWETGFRCASMIHGKIALLRKIVYSLSQESLEGALEKANQLKRDADEIEKVFQGNRSALLLVDDKMFQLLHVLKNMLSFTAHSIIHSVGDGSDLSPYVLELEEIEKTLIELDERMSTVLKEELSL